MSGQRRPAGPTIHVKRTIRVDSGSPKRRKLDHAKNGPDELQRSFPQHISVKREPSPSPPLSLVPRTSGTIRIDIPGNCLKNQIGWKDRRDKWVAEETSKLKRLGLAVPKRLIREDGLALDWVSAVPVCPLTLRPPIQGLSGAQIPQPQQAPIKQPVDLLGHALRDQLASSHLSSISGLKSSVHTQTDTPRQNGCEFLPQIADGDARAMSDFTIVGAATRKKPEVPGPERAVESASDDKVQWEHRKLLPPDLRPSTQFRYANREGAADRKARRIVWITKEIEKVEGYTGEKVGGFRYDGDDVIIYLNKAVYYARRRKEQAKETSNPSQLNHRQSRTSRPPPTGPRLMRITSPSAIASQENHARDPIPPHSHTSVSLDSGTTAGDMSTVTPDVPVPASSSKIAKNASPPNEVTTSTSVSDRTSTLSKSTIRESGAITQARGLDFLERYLQLFDSDRDSLSLAYTPNATFCLTEERYNNGTAIISQLPQILKTGRSAIVETLKKIRPDRHHSPSTDIAYNIATLDDMSTGGLLLTCEGTLIPVNQPTQKQRRQWHFSRIFVLKQSDEGSRQSWPLQIAAERLTIQRKVK